ncbi:hypothetical protein Tco_0633477 [Tanacetum coccineum]
METVFHISNCPEKYQVKYASCTLLNSALTWWNSHKRTIEIEAANAMSWAELMKVNDISVLSKKRGPKDGDRSQMRRTKLRDSLEGCLTIFRGMDMLEVANLQERRLDNNPRDNRGQQPVFKRQNVGGQNVARAYTTGNNEKRGMLDLFPAATSASCAMQGRVL